MGANCCSQNELKLEGLNRVNTDRKILPKSRQGAERIEIEDLVFNDENTTTEKIGADLYEEFSIIDDDEEEDEETDWENYENDITFKRKGNKTKDLFNPEIIEEVLWLVKPELKKIYKSKGALKIKSSDIPEEINPKEVEFKHIQVKNDEGDIYIGQFRKGTTIREGRGVLISHEDYIYEGFWIDDVKFGFGRVIMNNGNIYQGKWKNDKSHGQGIYLSTDGMVYKGDWKENKWEGKGVEVYKDNSKFVGQFKAGQKHGKGHFKWSDGKEYKGNYKKGQIDGFGEFKWADGKYYKGDWINNK